MRRSVPNWLISSGWLAPFGLSKRSAGPPAFTVRSTISVISRSGSTSAATRTSSPSRSSSAIHSRRSCIGIGSAPVAQPVCFLGDGDHREKDEAGHEHRQDGLPSLFGGCRGEDGEHRPEPYRTRAGRTGSTTTSANEAEVLPNSHQPRT